MDRILTQADHVICKKRNRNRSNVLSQGYTNSRSQMAVVNKFDTVVPIYVGLQHVTAFLSHFRRTEVGGGSHIFEKFAYP